MMLPKKGDAVIVLTYRKRIGWPRAIKSHEVTFRRYDLKLRLLPSEAFAIAPSNSRFPL